MGRLRGTPAAAPQPYPTPVPTPMPAPVPVPTGDLPPWTPAYVVGMVALCFPSIGIVGIVLGLRNRKYPSRRSQATLLLIVGIVFCIGMIIASQLTQPDTTT